MWVFLEYFYLLTLIATCVMCVIASTQDSFITAILLILLYLFAQFPMLWESPVNMFYLHAGTLLIMAGALHCEFAHTKMRLCLGMTITDVAWVGMPLIQLPGNSIGFPYHLFWWQSVVNILFLALCLVTF